MKTVNEVSQISGVSIRTLHYYDKIKLLKPTRLTTAGYRLYDDEAIKKLQQILLFRELEFPLKEIKAIINNPNYNQVQVLEKQITLLTMKKERLKSLISFARGIKMIGVNNMDFSAFDTKKIDDYTAQAKAAWGESAEFQEFEAKASKRGSIDNQYLTNQFMALFRQIGEIKLSNPASKDAQQQVKKLQDFISQHFYSCSNKILLELGKMYTAGGEMNENIDKVGGVGTAEFINQAIIVYCK
ncbi:MULTISPECIES: MerR family transcriptional regulator [unclassified Enterococcus]|uniref:MerR family transcriptional regulator n=1 Tax=unclassified Enterococcus TaxID=2608891 RepID=UPI00155697F9|nr:MULTISPECIES: MerR family transcriptional regulator [unclassified Enterococcus]MBS7578043.1 MerR family transcriptional regulator [Enterococcus sp. MMGLQ5-2]MBS7585267.1 MerR family transcriptional regulator [Enterococcus sp. MMGLQ5-1]NPD13124.1 MerR family transcriptional regulator [Enterococcus sp. MMGLQ5-1]NPD37874.1 MerR family transcriptional regulator [Enterococcus sp. MMGLQ5-2]